MIIEFLLLAVGVVVLAVVFYQLVFSRKSDRENQLAREGTRTGGLGERRAPELADRRQDNFGAPLVAGERRKPEVESRRETD